MSPTKTLPTFRQAQNKNRGESQHTEIVRWMVTSLQWTFSYCCDHRCCPQRRLHLMWSGFFRSHHHVGYDGNVTSSCQQKLPFLASLSEKVTSFLLFLQRKYLKHQAFENEVNGRAEQVEGVINLGNSLIEQRACDGNEETMKVGVLPSMGFDRVTRRYFFYSFIVSMCRDMGYIFCLVAFPLIIA